MSVGAGSGKKLPVLPAREPIAECGVCGQPMYRNQSIDQCSWRQKGELADLQCPLWDLTWDWNCEDRFPAVAGDELGKADVENALNVLGEVRDDDGSLIDVPGPDLVYDAAGKPHEPMEIGRAHV